MWLNTPLELDWMPKEELDFRASVPALIQDLPKYSFLDSSSFKVHGFADNGIQAVVAKISDKNGNYVAKIRNDRTSVPLEALSFRKWRAAGTNTLEVLDLVSPENDGYFPISIMPFIEIERADVILRAEPPSAQFFAEIGTNLALMHKVKGKNFGDIINFTDLTGEFVELKSEVETLLTSEVLERLAQESILTEADYPIVEKATQILADVSESTLIHNDLGPHNIFGTEKIVIFDGRPRLFHPMIDVATSITWIGRYGQGAIDELTKSYANISAINPEDLNAAFIIQLIFKLNKWLIRSATEPKVLPWIEAGKKKLRLSIEALK
jgi:tRNA A-37 threonylcarbamoyl transferase component Bud32